METTPRDGESAADTREMDPFSPWAVRVPGWDKYPWLRAAFSTRAHGASQVYGPKDMSRGEQNLGWTREDDPAHVRTNRQTFLRWVTGNAEAPLVTLRQVHGGTVHFARAAATSSAESAPPLEGDGLVSQESGCFLGILTADCVPILLADTRTRTVAALHAGWRGTLARIAERGVQLMEATYGSRPQDLVAAIGPAIRPCCFEVGEEVRSGFRQSFSNADALFSTGPDPLAQGRLRMDLQQANQQQLLAVGLGMERIEVIRECTACCRLPDGKRKYFSYRAEKGVTGRMMSVIGTTPTPSGATITPSES